MAALAAGPQVSCSDSERQQFARAQRITANTQLIGGPSARGEVGDYLMENDQVRVIVQDLSYNRGSGLFGGSLIDADVTRIGSESDLLAGNGHDSFGEMFPAFFLEVVDPQEIALVQDGKDGEAAVIEVRGKGGEFVTMARLLNQVMINSYDAQKNLNRALKVEPPRLDLEPQVDFTVRYTLEPDTRHIRVDSTLRNISLKKLEFPNKSVVSLLTGALGIDLGDFSVPSGHVLGFGKLNSPFLPGIGYDLQFGLEDAYKRGVNLPALPGHTTPIVATSSKEGISYGYAIDVTPRETESLEEFAAREHFVYSKDQLMDADGQPFYGGNSTPGDMLFLFYASGFGGVFTHQLPEELAPSFCGTDATADAEAICAAYVGACTGEECTEQIDDCVTAYPKCRGQIDEDGLASEYTYTSYLLIGDGDVSSLWDELYKIRGVDVQQVKGRMIDTNSGQPAGQGETLLIYQARTDTTDASTQCTEEITDEAKLEPYIYSQVYSKEGGFFTLTLPPGTYCYRTRSTGRHLSDYVRFKVVEGKDLYIEPGLMPAGHIDAYAVDEAGNPLPARVTIVGTHDYFPDAESPRDFLFDLKAGERWRITDFVPDVEGDPSTLQYIEQLVYMGASGHKNFKVRPNTGEQTYKVYFSRGPEYEADVREVTVKPGQTVRVVGQLVRSVDTTGYLSGDFHLHARGSIDSGLDYNTRVISLAGEGLEVAVSSDHNYVSDFAPYIQANDLQLYMNSVIGLELTTFEAGHFNAFPLEYDVELANRGSFQWQEQPPGLIFEELRQRGEVSADDTIIQVNHPRDTILGYFSQHNVDPLDGTVTLPFLTDDAGLTDAIATANGPAFYEETEDGEFEATFSWNFDAIEIFNGKRMELLRHFRADRATLEPVYIDYYKQVALDDTDGYNASSCERARTKLAGDCAADAAADGCDDARTKDGECAAAEAAAEATATQQANAHLAVLGDGKVIVCDANEVAHPGHLDDWYNMLNNERPFGTRPYEDLAIQDAERLERYKQLYKRYTATGNSDSHRAEFDDPGYPRNYFWVGHDDPARMTPQELTDAIKSHHNIVTNGPFVTMTINGEPIGSELTATDGDVEIELTVREPTWIVTNRYRLIANGEVVKEGTIATEDHEWKEKFSLTINRDTWFVVEVEGDQSMFPMLAPAEIPPFDLQSAIGSLAGPFGFGGGVEGLEPELTFQVTPFAFTNPIWVVQDGDGVFSPPNNAQAVCKDGLIEVPEGTVPGAAVAGQKLGDKRLDALNMPFPVHNHHDKPVTSRIKGEMHDVRIIFEAWGHSH